MPYLYLCHLGHLMKLTWEKGHYHYGSHSGGVPDLDRDVPKQRVYMGQSSHNCSWKMGLNKWKMLVNMCKIKVLASTQADIPQEHRGIWLLTLHAVTAHVVITYYQYSCCWLLIKCGEKKHMACDVRELVQGQIFMRYKSV